MAHHVPQQPGMTSHLAGQLFLHFVREQLKVDAPFFIDLLRSLSAQSETSNDPDYQYIATTLDQLADEFKRYEHRQLTKDEANKPNLELSETDFAELVRMLLGPESDQHLSDQIVVMFFYFYDFMMRMAIKGTPRMDEVLQWSQQAFSQHLDAKVDAAGGWRAVLKTPKTGFLSSITRFFSFGTRRKN
ncbi:uncharacterized protein LOC131940045 [Physella acuta]|uniref:uncharacterized protein LOC131940045 n=1 Tax=Physella acuta TaxID=109671 RepID=UPI0027DBB1BA|nr:uncharacterized protein LOC131940045 [Physella acuta]XP_059154569.1 uncharacterized protein LOC131940045 [Physella acuta]